jgi:hypothetical protein
VPRVAGVDVRKAAPEQAPPPAEEPLAARDEALPSPRQALEGGEALEGAAAETRAVEMDDLQRLDLYARRALATDDWLAAARALAFWRDSLAFRTDLDPARKRAAAALVDTLAAREEERRREAGGGAE